MDITEMTVRFSPRQDDIVREVSKLMKRSTCFELEGVLFKGNAYHAAVLFAHNNPEGGDFYVWVQKNFKQLGNV